MNSKELGEHLIKSYNNRIRRLLDMKVEMKVIMHEIVAMEAAAWLANPVVMGQVKAERMQRDGKIIHGFCIKCDGKNDVPNPVCRTCYRKEPIDDFEEDT